MTRRQLLKSLTAAGGAHAAVKRRPNILLIMADDLGFSDIGCYGSEIATPNLDRLAAGGVRFTHFSNTARCCPTRSSLMTGLYPHQTGVGHMMGDYGRPGYRGDLNRNCVTIAEALRTAGYRAYMSGKWHVTPAEAEKRHNWPRQRGFERFYGTIHGAGSFYDPVTLVSDDTPIRAQGRSYYYTDAIAENAARMIAEHGRSHDPFFLYAAFTAPHWPLHAFETDIAKYADRYRAGWDALRVERHERMKRLGILSAKWPLAPRDKAVTAWLDTPDQDWQARRMAVYAAQIDRLDRQIGRVLEAVKAAGAEENTLVMFLSDNGGCAEELNPLPGRARPLHIPRETRDGRPMRPGNDPKIMPGADDTYASYGIGWAHASNTPFRLYKHWVHEGGISTPFIACWPSVISAKNSITSQPGHVIDVMATCLDAAGARYPKRFADTDVTPIEGKSLLPLFRGRTRQPHDLFWEHEGNRAAKRGKWKLVSRYPGEWELYDLDEDRTELNNLAATHPDKVSELSSAWDAWARRCGVESWRELPRGRPSG